MSNHWHERVRYVSVLSLSDFTQRLSAIRRRSAPDASIGTITTMSEREHMKRMVTTPLVSSFIGRARKGDMSSTDPVVRSAAWAQWAASNIEEFKGLSERAYAAIVLPGAFYDPRGLGPSVRPHLEIPERSLTKADTEFPDRLASAGMALLFPWWVMSEVTAVKRALLTTPSGPIVGLLDALQSRRLGLEAAYREALGVAESSWDHLEALLLTDPARLVDDVCGSFDSSEVATVLAPAAGLGVEVVFDRKLRETQGDWSTRRVGVWQIRGLVGTPQEFSLGVVTPRLTANSLFKDPLFAIESEGLGALLVRVLLLRRLVSNQIEGILSGAVAPDPVAMPQPTHYLRAIVAQVGAKLPEASEAAAVHFLQRHPDAAEAWSTLQKWAGEKYMITVSEDSFAAAHGRATRLIRRAEAPTRDDINLILPIAWCDGKVVRVTFNRQ